MKSTILLYGRLESSSRCWQLFQQEWSAVKCLSEWGRTALSTSVCINKLALWHFLGCCPQRLLQDLLRNFLSNAFPLGHAIPIPVFIFLKRHSVFPWVGGRIFDLYQIISFLYPDWKALYQISSESCQTEFLCCLLSDRSCSVPNPHLLLLTGFSERPPFTLNVVWAVQGPEEPYDWWPGATVGLVGREQPKQVSAPMKQCCMSFLEADELITSIGKSGIFQLQKQQNCQLWSYDLKHWQRMLWNCRGPGVVIIKQTQRQIRWYSWAAAVQEVLCGFCWKPTKEISNQLRKGFWAVIFPIVESKLFSW